MQEDDEEVESLLRRFRPVGPSDELRQRIVGLPLSTMGSMLRLWRFAAAAMIGLAALLVADAQRIARDSARIATAAPAWTHQAETAVAILGGGEDARRYVAVTLALDERRLRSTAERSY